MARTFILDYNSGLVEWTLVDSGVAGAGRAFPVRHWL